MGAVVGVTVGLNVGAVVGLVYLETSRFERNFGMPAHAQIHGREFRGFLKIRPPKKAKDKVLKDLTRALRA